MTNRGIQPMKCMSVNPPPLHFPLCFNSPANTEDVIGVSLVLLTLQGFASHHAIMMHNNCLYISARIRLSNLQHSRLHCAIRLDTDLIHEV